MVATKKKEISVTIALLASTSAFVFIIAIPTAPAQAADGCLSIRVTFESLKVYDVRDFDSQSNDAARNNWYLYANVNGVNLKLLEDIEVRSNRELDFSDVNYYLTLDSTNPHLTIHISGHDNDIFTDWLGVVHKTYTAVDNFGVGFHDELSVPTSRDEDSGGEYSIRYSIETVCNASTPPPTANRPSPPPEENDKLVQITSPKEGSNFFDDQSGQVLVELTGYAQEGGVDCVTGPNGESTCINMRGEDLSWFVDGIFVGSGSSNTIGFDDAGCDGEVQHTIRLEAKFSDGTTKSASVKISTGSDHCAFM